MTVKKAIELIKVNNNRHLMDIEYYNEVLKIFEESYRIDPPRSDLSKQMRQIFLDMLGMMKKIQEMQIQFNHEIIKTLIEKRNLL